MAELTSQPTSVQSVYSLYREDRLFVNRRYQRKLVWTLLEKQKLVESILKKYPIPAILLAEKEDQPGSYEIIDGLQRLHAIVSFIETSFPTLENKIFNLNFFPTAKGFKEAGLFTSIETLDAIGQKEVSSILDYTLALSVMRSATEDEVNDVFDRINTYGHRLSDQERRQAGISNEFSEMVRELSCHFRGDVSKEIVPLYEMPSISIDLPKTKHGYNIEADEVFWVNQGILRSTDLRDSMDEQCVADIAACIVSSNLIEQSKEALDDLYRQDSDSSNLLLSALEVYGSPKLKDEMKFCVQEILKVCTEEKAEKLRNIVFKNGTTNAFPSVFAVVVIAFHELIIKENKKISNYKDVRTSLNDLSARVGRGQRATSASERRRNIDTVKGLINGNFVPAQDLQQQIYNDHKLTDIDTIIRRSEIELANYELKQGLLVLKAEGKLDPNMIAKLANTICAIANNGKNSSGKIILGVTDKESDAKKATEIDSIVPKKIGKRTVIGINREAKRLGLSVEKYVTLLKEGLKKSGLSDEVLFDVMSNLDYNSFYDLGVIVYPFRLRKHPHTSEIICFGEMLTQLSKLRQQNK